MRTIQKKPKPRLRVINSDTGEVFENTVIERRRGYGLTGMYGPNWAAVPISSLHQLAMTLPARELRLLCFMISKMRPGNHVDLRPIDIANELGMHRSNLQHALRGLREKRIVVDRKPFGFRINPNFVFRGDPEGVVGKRRDGELVLLA